MDLQLDNLGWYEFEQLIQTLLKARLGMGVEAWGGRGDWGRDAYCREPLPYPSKKPERGPFVFQCKFVEGANAAGAECDALIVTAVKRECERIQQRLSSGKWEVEPAHFCLLTNAPLSPRLRKKIDGSLSRVLRSSRLHAHDGPDISRWLDTDRTIIRSFPQLLSLRDLNQLLHEIVNSAILTRSESAVGMAEAASRAFVPTSAYFEAFEKLRKYAFVILEGPPEMGKTTIGRMVALTQLTLGWEAIECRGPTDLLSTYNGDVPQVFVADDCFGRTEYDPSRVSAWQADLPHVLHRLDPRHWLILTSRAHLLQMAKGRLDVADQRERFLEVNEVVVNAGDLTTVEKARILYRHGKANLLSDKAKSILRVHAERITSNEHFTPERIRTLVADVIPGIVASGVRHRLQKGWMIDQAIARPTHRMQQSFRSLPSAHRWLMYCLLCGDGWLEFRDREPNDVGLEEQYESLCPRPVLRPFAEVISELSEGFVQKLRGEFGEVLVSWIHPSCQDLAIDELAANVSDRRHFLRRCPSRGLFVATSVGGGPKGLRNFPLLRNEQDWQCFEARAGKLAAEEPRLLAAMEENLTTAKREARTVPEIRTAITRFEQAMASAIVPGAVRALELENYQWAIASLESVLHSRNRFAKTLPVNLSKVWKYFLGDIKKRIPSKVPLWECTYAPSAFRALLWMVQKSDPGFLREPEIRASVVQVYRLLADRGEAETRTHYETPRGDELLGCIEGYRELRDAYAELAALPQAPGEYCQRLLEASVFFGRRASSLEEEVPPEPDWDGSELPSRTSARSSEVDVTHLFRDL